MGKFEKGNPGRTKGVKNKSIARSKLADYVDTKWSKFESEMDTLKGRAFIENFIRVLPFVMPQYSAISFSLRSMSEDDLKFLIEKLKEQNNENDTD